MFGRKSRQRKHHLALSVQVKTLGTHLTPIVSVSGSVQGGSAGNAAVAQAYGQMLELSDFSRPDIELVVYDFTALEYQFGDHLAGFFWTLPAVLDGVGVVVAASGETRDCLESLYEFCGSWLSLCFFDTVLEAELAITSESQEIEQLSALSEQCSQYGTVFLPGETGVSIVLHGSRQTGMQWFTGAKWTKESDVDVGVVGGPREMALLTAKLQQTGASVPNMQHPPSSIWTTAEEAAASKLVVINPSAG